jgi:hypothetical protein
MADWQFVPREPQELRVRPARHARASVRLGGDLPPPEKRIDPTMRINEGGEQ